MIESQLRERWELSALSAVQRLGGTNNLSWRIETPDGGYILRLYQNAGRIPHIAYEHALLLRLAQTGLSFAVPAPVVSSTGHTLERIEDGSGGATYASLSPVIPGRRALPDHVETRAAGTALAELDEALRQIDLPDGMIHFPTHARLEQIHPLVPDPHDAVRGFPVDDDVPNRYAELVVRAEQAGRPLYRSLPSQIVHNDIARSNMLIDERRVSGILDFEFAGPDLRALDPAVGFLMFCADWSDSSFNFDVSLVQAFAEGYREHVSLASVEGAAIPDLLRLRSAVSVIHRLGRWRAGLASVDDVASRMREGLRLDAWFAAHEQELHEAIESS